MTKTKLRTSDLALCALFSALIAAGAFIRVPVPVVPFTLQTLFTALAGMLLGRRLGALAVGVYIALGLLGLPVFTAGGGLGYVFQPTFGYILGFAGGAYIAGRMTESGGSLGRYYAAGLAHLAVVYAVGLAYYYCIANYYMHSPMGVGALLLHGFLITLPGDLALCLVSALLAKRLRPMLRRQ